MSAITPVTMPASDKGNDPADNLDPDFTQTVKERFEKATDPLAWVEEYIPDPEQLEQWANPSWVYPNLIIENHLVSIHADAGAGKTTILMHLCCEIAKSHKVFYVNADLSGGDAHRYRAMADSAGFQLLLPDFMPGLSMRDVVKRLESINGTNADLSGTVWVFDTFKKLCDVIQKQQVKELLGLLRGLAAKGATIILLGHNNKHRDQDGNSVYEGTGDVRSDVDELIFLTHIKEPDGSMTVTTKPDKVRGDFSPMSFRIGADRSVTLLDQVVDVATRRIQEDQLRDDGEVIDVIRDFLQSKTTIKQKEIVAHCREQTGVGRRAIVKVLDRYCGGTNSKWCRIKGDNNSWLYKLDGPSPWKGENRVPLS